METNELVRRVAGDCMWKPYLKKIKYANWIAPVSYFKHAPFASCWDTIAVPNILVELPLLVNGNVVDMGEPINWIAKFYGYAGYKALGRFLPYSNPTPPTSASADNVEPSQNFWVNLFAQVVKPLGFSQANNILLHPTAEWSVDLIHLGNFIYQLYQIDMTQKNGKPVTIPTDFSAIVSAEIEKCRSRFQLGQIVEVLDKHDCSGYRLARICNMVGDRIFVVYLNTNDNKKDERSQGFWFSQHSPHVHKMGWCKTVTAPLRGVNLKLHVPKLIPAENKADFPDTPSNLKIEEQMIFEMQHPIFPHKICTGYVIKILRYGFFVAGTDWSRKNELVEIVLHVSSDYIFPLGFCRQHKIPFDMPDGETLSWKQYLSRHKLKAFIPPTIPKSPNKFTKGCKLEAVNIIEPVRLHPATVTQVAGRLLRIHFDGFSRDDPESFQWVSCDSSAIYPAGYAEMMGHPIGKSLPDPPNIVDMYERN